MLPPKAYRRNLKRPRLTIAQLRALIAAPHPTCSSCGAIGVLQVHGGYNCRSCFSRRKPWDRWHRRSIRGEAVVVILELIEIAAETGAVELAPRSRRKMRGAA